MSMTGATMKRDMTLWLEEYETEFNTFMTLNGSYVSSMAVYLL
jgi:hypothetical protein